MTIQDDFAALCEAAYEELAECEPYYIDPDGTAHVTLGLEIIERCKGWREQANARAIAIIKAQAVLRRLTEDDE